MIPIKAKFYNRDLPLFRNLEDHKEKIFTLTI